MIKEPIISMLAFGSSFGKRRQFISTISLQALRKMVSSVLDCKTKGAGLRADSLVARRIATEWRENEEIFCIEPIVVAITCDCDFTVSSEWGGTGAGFLELTLNSILDVCDGIQRVAAIDYLTPTNNELRHNEWPVHFISVSDEEDLVALNSFYRRHHRQHRRLASRSKAHPGVEEWTKTAIHNSIFLQKAIALNRSSLAPRSSQLWAGSAVRKAFREIQISRIVESTTESAIIYATLWDQIPSFIKPLGLYLDSHLPASKIRTATILAMAPTFHAIAMAVALSMARDKCPPEEYLERLQNLDWATGRQQAKLTKLKQRKDEWTHRVLATCGLQPYTHQVIE